MGRLLTGLDECRCTAEAEGSLEIGGDGVDAFGERGQRPLIELGPHDRTKAQVAALRRTQRCGGDHDPWVALECAAHLGEHSPDRDRPLTGEDLGDQRAVRVAPQVLQQSATQPVPASST